MQFFLGGIGSWFFPFCPSDILLWFYKLFSTVQQGLDVICLSGAILAEFFGVKRYWVNNCKNFVGLDLAFLFLSIKYTSIILQTIYWNGLQSKH